LGSSDVGWGEPEQRASAYELVFSALRKNPPVHNKNSNPTELARIMSILDDLDRILMPPAQDSVNLYWDFALSHEIRKSIKERQHDELCVQHEIEKSWPRLVGALTAGCADLMTKLRDTEKWLYQQVIEPNGGRCKGYQVKIPPTLESSLSEWQSGRFNGRLG
jgi:hypothetical protein